MFYLSGRGWGLSPAEFWEMTLQEFMLEFEERRPRDAGDYAGSLRRGDVLDLMEWNP